MAGGTLTVTGLSASEPGGQRALGPLTVQNSVVVGETLAAPLLLGDNTFTVPANAMGVVVIPPSTGTAALKVRFNTNSADAGTPISATQPSVFTFNAAALPTSVIVNAGTAQTSPVTLWFW